jgi:hypothetical protein
MVEGAAGVASEVSAPPTLRIATRCQTINEFIARFARFADETSIFISTMAPLGKSAERRFVFQLVDGSAVMWGHGVVIEPRADQAGFRGIRLSILELTGANRGVHQALLAARAEAKGGAVPGPRLARGSIPPVPATAPPRPRPRSIPPPIPQASLRPRRPTGPAPSAQPAEATEHDRWEAFLRERPAAAQETIEFPGD